MSCAITVKQSSWDLTRAGEPVERYTLSAPNGVEVSLSNLGASLVQWLAPDREGRSGNVVLGFETPQDYLDSSTHMGGIIGRWANRIADAQFVLDGNCYQLEANDGVNSLHGGSLGFDRLIWQAQILDAGVRFTLRSADGDAGFPGELMVSVEYRLDEHGALTLDYTAKSNAPTPINLTNHTYFNLAATGTALDHIVTLAADQVLPTDAGGIPYISYPADTPLPADMPALLDVDGTGFDFRSGAIVRDHLEKNDAAIRVARGIDHYFIGSSPAVDRDRLHQPLAQAYDPTSGRELHVFSTAPGVQFYTASNLEGVMGKAGVRHRSFDALCFETGAQPNQINAPDAATAEAVVLRPGHMYRQTTVLRISAR